MKSIPKNYTLSNGQTCPIIGIGTSTVGTTELITDIIYHSIKDGVRLIDTASCYKSEEGVGLGISKAISEGIVKREDLFVITKCDWHDRCRVEDALKDSLKKLNLTYVDLYLDHWPFSYYYDSEGNKKNNIPMHKFWEGMEKLVKSGLTKNIGCSNYNVQSLVNILSFCEIKPTFLEVEFHPYLCQQNLLNFCKKEKIQIIGYNPICKGNYDYHEGKEKLDLDLFKEPLLIELSKKYNKTIGQIVFNWFIYKEVIPIPMTRSITRMKENLDSNSFIMEKEDYEKIDSINKNYRFGSSLTWHNFGGVDIFA